ncbi:SixA phosphatase family protein [Salinimicrobium soli]|uniref:SixA phosphatase family protein n=1 Tax=Salinimicrobium soli TaxID=1254399 RepID=UPI003AAEFFBC
MKTFYIFIISLICTVINPTEVSAQQNQDKMTTYYFIRHAEKDTTDPTNRDPELTEKGKQRAENWARIFKEVEFDHIYTTDYSRTRATAQAVAKSQQNSVEIYDPRQLYSKDFQGKTSGKTVLVVGHSNTNPQFVNLILGEKVYGDIDESESGSLFIVTVGPDGTKKAEVLYIN